MTEAPEQLLDELVTRWAQGEPLAVDDLLRRAGPRADELAALIDVFLQRAPRREPSSEALAYVRALDVVPPLLQARQARRLRLDDVADGLVRLLGLPAEARGKARSHYQDLELGRLDPAGVAASVWAALARLFERDADALAAAPPPAPVAGTAMYRATSRLEPAITDYATANRREPLEVDEVDRLFGVS